MIIFFIVIGFLIIFLIFFFIVALPILLKETKAWDIVHNKIKKPKGYVKNHETFHYNAVTKGYNYTGYLYNEKTHEKAIHHVNFDKNLKKVCDKLVYDEW